MVKSICDIMNKEVLTVSPWVSVATAVSIMNQFRVSGLPVLDNEHLIGIITSRNVRESHPNRLVADAMTRNPIVVQPELSLWKARELLERHQIERLIVVEDDRVVGITTKTLVYTELGKYTDPMTELPRAEYLYQTAIDLLEGYQDIAIIFIDIDNFGKVDKQYGHVLGDHVLQQIGEILKENVPTTGCLCRYAGDEFAFILPATNTEARELARLLVEKIAQMVFIKGIRISASAGVSGGRRSNKRTYGEKKCTIIDLVNMASLASTKAKRQKCQVVVADSVHMVEVS